MRYLIIGGAGFIGVNLANRLAGMGHEVIVADNLSRHGTDKNLEWLREQHPAVLFRLCDIRHFDELKKLFKEYKTFDVVIHLAGQVAVTTSVTDPRSDFEMNALGTFNVLEAVRLSDCDPIFLFSSTNKVYGEMEHIDLVEHETRYAFRDHAEGIDESCPLDFHSPYGCSKGCADQYVHDYSRIYGLRSVVFRQSAIYGPRQFGIEDQGWAAWFTIAALKGYPLTIYGDGKQVRDLLWVDDLADAYIQAVERIDEVQGEIFNIGGGPENSVSIWYDFEPLLSREIGSPIKVTHGDWRPGDQKVCIMNINKAKQRLGWQPKTSVEQGVANLVKWVRENLYLF